MEIQIDLPGSVIAKLTTVVTIFGKSNVEKALKGMTRQLAEFSSEQMPREINQITTGGMGRLASSVTLFDDSSGNDYAYTIGPTATSLTDGAQYGIFVDLGTGLKGATYPISSAPSWYIYNTHPSPWVWTDNNGNFYTTYGMAGSEFLEHTFDRMTLEAMIALDTFLDTQLSML